MSPPTKIICKPIVLNIFHFLEGKDLISCSLVSNRWRSIILERPELTKKIVFTITCDTTKPTIHEEFLKKFGKSLQVVKLRGKLSNMRVFVRVSLKYLTQVKEIDCDFSNGRTSTYYGDISFPNLTVLILRDVSSANLLAKLFAASEINDLAINVSGANKLLTKGFLQWFRSRPLKKLIIDGIDYDIYWTLSALNTYAIEFQLKSFVIQFTVKEKKSIVKEVKEQTLSESVSRCFQSQNEIEVLELCNVDLRLLSMILNQCLTLSGSLKQLKIDVINMDSPYQMNLKRAFINHFLSTLIYIDKNQTATEHFQDFVRIFPNITRLELLTNQKKTKKILNFIPENLKNLKVLKIDYLKGGKCNFTTTFEHLVELYLLGCFIMNEEWMSLVNNMPNLKKLSLNIFILTLKNWGSMSKLEYFCLGYGSFKSDLLDQLTDNCQELKNLVVTGSTMKMFEPAFELGLPYKVHLRDSEFLEEVQKNEMLFDKLKSIKLIIPSGVELVSNYDDIKHNNEINNF